MTSNATLNFKLQYYKILCVWMCIFMGQYMYTCVQVSVPVEAIHWCWVSSSTTLYHTFRDKVTHCTQSLPIWLDCLACKPPGSSGLTLPNTGIVGTHHHTRLLSMQEIILMSSCFCNQHFTNWAMSLVLHFYLKTYCKILSCESLASLFLLKIKLANNSCKIANE